MDLIKLLTYINKHRTRIAGINKITFFKLLPYKNNILNTWENLRIHQRKPNNKLTIKRIQTNIKHNIMFKTLNTENLIHTRQKIENIYHYTYELEGKN